VPRASPGAASRRACDGNSAPEPAEFVLQELFAAAPVALPPHDHGIELSVGQAGVWFEIQITEGTNTKDEKAAFVAAVFKRMGELLGPLHENSYVHAFDARADGYGFGGLTAERRYIAGKLGTKLSAAA
jgi:phenylpyruvate tautomerase PptA (4-oxalocrotonate tautomerase family)